MTKKSEHFFLAVAQSSNMKKTVFGRRFAAACRDACNRVLRGLKVTADVEFGCFGFLQAWQ